MDIQTYISHCWKGQEKLWKIFWLWYVALSVALVIGTMLTVKYVYAARFVEQWLPYVLMFVFIYGPWVMVSLWRCAFNTRWKLLGYLTRIWVVVFSLASILVLSSAFWIPWLYQQGYMSS